MLVTFAAMLLGCAETDDGNEPAAVTGPVIETSASSDGFYPSALLTGVTLELREGCLLARDNVLVWPRGTTWDADQQAVKIADWVQPPTVGERFSVGGGAIPFLDGFPRAVSPEAQERVMQCRAALGVDSLWLVAPDEPRAD